MRVSKQFGRSPASADTDLNRRWRIGLASLVLAIAIIAMAWRFLNALLGDGEVTAMVVGMFVVILLASLGGKAAPTTIRAPNTLNRHH